jgi:phosphotransferase system  glucose/maltose/N-acetylglucosamine-specific IIC component
MTYPWAVINLAQSTSAPLSALIWWLIPLVAMIGALIYVLWVTKFQSKFEARTERSVGKFKKFQDSFNPSENSKE